MARYAIVTKIEVYNTDELIGTVEHEDGIGYKAKLEDAFMEGKDIAFLGKVLDFADTIEDDFFEERKNVSY